MQLGQRIGVTPSEYADRVPVDHNGRTTALEAKDRVHQLRQTWHSRRRLGLAPVRPERNSAGTSGVENIAGAMLPRPRVDLRLGLERCRRSCSASARAAAAPCGGGQGIPLR
jgi:hypothetical protein